MVNERGARQGPDAGGRRRRRAADRLRGDPTRLSQALLNLLSNAVKFTDRGGIEMRVQARPARRRRRCKVRFTVARHRHRHHRRADRQAVRAVRAGRQLDDAALRRHRARPGDHAPSGAADGRRGRRGQRAGTRQPVLVRGQARNRRARRARRRGSRPDAGAARWPDAALARGPAARHARRRARAAGRGQPGQPGGRARMAARRRAAGGRGHPRRACGRGGPSDRPTT